MPEYTPVIEMITNYMERGDGTAGADLGGGCRGCAHPPEMTCGFVIQLVFCQKKYYVVYWR